ncbi:MAG: carboxypeptidase-like regulatory domain-containing protein [Tannerellaceae bacterium]|nr:carboxypeptidase-like regulatory domain-containing protein [Tannerellaceae bacterium]
MIRKNILSKLLPGSFMLVSLLCSPYLQANTPGSTVEMEQPGIPQERTISGTVTEKGDPLIGATVRVKDTNEGTITDLDGKFTIKAAPGAILIVSYIGYVTQEINIGQQSMIAVELLPTTQDIDEVVVVGYGTMKKSDITGSMINVSEKVIKQAPVSNVATALQGLAAGVDVQMEGGSTHPGAVATIRVRGERSLNAEKDALIIVDGIPFSGTLNELSTDDIASVSILKDASATAIYGSRGASGVILITTKRGHAGKTTVNYSGYYGITTPIKQYDLMNSEQFMRMKQWANYNANPDLYSGPDDPSMMVLGALFRDQAEINGYNNGTDTNWQDLVFENGMTTNHQVSVNGGNEKKYL